jgi:nucleotide-binding universal stress UspA family protein
MCEHPSREESLMSTSGKLVIVAGVQFDWTADHVWDRAQTLLWSRPDAELHLVHVVGPEVIAQEGKDPSANPTGDAMKKLHAWVCEKAGGADAPICMQIHLDVPIGKASQEIVQAAVDVEADLILVGTHGRKGVARALLGSVAEDVLRNAPCGVLVARPKDASGYTKSPSIAPPPEEGHKPFHPHASRRRSNVVFSSYNANLFPTGISRSSVR